MVRYEKVNYIDQATQANKVKIFMIFGEIQFETFCTNNGIVIRNSTASSAMAYLLTKKDQKMAVITGKETLK
jgi:hypothetical protein